MTINSWIESYGDQFFGNYDLSQLKRDECYVTVDNKAFPEVYLYEVYEECLGCPYTYKDGPIPINTEKTITLNTRFTKYLRIGDKNGAEIPNVSPYYNLFNEFGIYKVDCAQNTCGLGIIVKEPVSIYFPMLTVFLIYGLIFSLIPITQFLWKKFKSENLILDTNPPKKKERVKSLDTFRGISIVLMIFVNYGHGGYPFLEHAPWNGLYVGDLVFPWFLWIMGVCIPISITSALKKNTRRMKIFQNIFKRSCKLFAIGLFLGAAPYFDTMRIPGVLQRFAIGYFIVASLCAFTLSSEIEECRNFLKHVQDILKLKFLWIIMILILTLHTCLTFLLEVPNCPSGYLGPGGNHDGGKYKGCTGGAAGYIDLILGKHIYQGAIITEMYESQPFDPEGILGCLTTIFQVFLGVQAGMILMVHKCHKMRLLRWLIWAIICGLIGGGLCNFSKEDGWIPLNKHLWSLSFVLVTSCFAFILLSACYLVIDMLKIWTGKPFLFAGMNAIFMYIGHNMTYSNFPIHWYTSADNINPTHFMMLIENVWATSFWVIVSYYLYKIEYFLTL